VRAEATARAGLPSGPVAPETTPRRRLTPLRIAVIYVVVGLAWIAFSDRALELLVPSDTLQHRLQTVKGWFYVVATGGLLHLLVSRLAAELRRRDEAVRATLDGMADAVLVLDAGGRVVEANQAAVALLRVAGTSELLVSFAALASRFDLRRADGAALAPDELSLERVLAGETVRALELSLRRPDGEEVFVELTASPVRERRGGPGRLAVAVLRDMSEVRHFRELREDFLATAAHEFKTPLAVIKAQAQLLEKRAAVDPQALRAVGRQVERLTRLTQQLLELSRSRLGEPARGRERYDLGDQAEAVAERRRPLSGDHALRVTRAAPAPVLADRARIEQVLDNLLDNAVRFSPAGCEVEVTVARQGAEARVSIRDRGVGIPRDRQDRIFERYYRAHAGTDEDYGGLGVGLGLSREILARHGGRIWFQSEPGAGSTFTFALPLAEGA
jgi:signal transduction histidine kinase